MYLCLIKSLQKWWLRLIKVQRRMLEHCWSFKQKAHSLKQRGSTKGAVVSDTRMSAPLWNEDIGVISLSGIVGLNQSLRSRHLRRQSQENQYPGYLIRQSARHEASLPTSFTASSSLSPLQMLQEAKIYLNNLQQYTQLYTVNKNYYRNQRVGFILVKHSNYLFCSFFFL